MWALLIFFIVPLHATNCTDIKRRTDCIPDCDCHWCSNNQDYTDLDGFCTDHGTPCEYFHDVNDNYHCTRYWFLFATLSIIFPILLISFVIYVILQYQCVIQNCFRTIRVAPPSRIPSQVLGISINYEEIP